MSEVLFYLARLDHKSASLYRYAGQSKTVLTAPLWERVCPNASQSSTGYP
ncbi:hypothetical protein PS723_04488 [Pseudomonas fluorescens]|uniref:Uncharacterized protein n=1 Tax=Pseudomonas fluorescens TaxID=294 RepID=A0A5E7ECT6_PSEFL|nr:hypothetical protein PS723_04488 [Pseudomonas fluorescens]